MLKHFQILALSLLIKLSSLGQASLPVKIFHKHFQKCHFIGTTEEDFIIVINVDSTINLTKYSSNYLDEYNTIIKQTYTGSYSLYGDTLRAEFTERNSAMKSKIKTTNTVFPKVNMDMLVNKDKFFEYPPVIYVINTDKIISADGSFPSLDNSTAMNLFLLESKFINWDKISIYHKEIFGVTK